MGNHFIAGVMVVLIGALSISACRSSNNEPTQVSRTTSKTTTGGAESVATGDPLSQVMVPYEQCHRLLAADTGDGVQLCAADVAAAAVAAQKNGSKATNAHLSAIEMAARKLSRVPSSDLAALRLAYGELSRSVVSLVAATPTAKNNYHVFECPMAKGYKRWVQPSGKLVNPYMGTAMLTCGSEVPAQ